MKYYVLVFGLLIAPSVFAQSLQDAIDIVNGSAGYKVVNKTATCMYRATTPVVANVVASPHLFLSTRSIPPQNFLDIVRGRINPPLTPPRSSECSEASININVCCINNDTGEANLKMTVLPPDSLRGKCETRPSDSLCGGPPNRMMAYGGLIVAQQCLNRNILCCDLGQGTYVWSVSTCHTSEQVVKSLCQR